ncbi:MAG TPA: hypothetical protein VFQ38_03300 [Longimicrobiales bacterium]|nr:hypothetical protein [Longimicrobiales bacterium]
MQMAMRVAGGGILAILTVLIGKMLLGWLGAMVAFVAALAFKLLLLAVLVWGLVWVLRRVRGRPRTEP